MPTLSISHPLLRFPLLLAALAFAWWAAKTGQAGIYQFQANSYVELWQHQRLKNPDFQVSNEQYQSTLDKSRQALNLVPYNTDYWTTIADMQLWYLSNTANIPITQHGLTVILILLPLKPVLVKWIANLSMHYIKLTNLVQMKLKSSTLLLN